MSSTDQRTPKRFQLSRRKGFMLPANTVNVARPGKWGNPFRVMEAIKPDETAPAGRYIAVPTAAEAVARFRSWLMNNEAGQALALLAKRELRGKNLACWCKLGDPCHADVLIEIANPRSSDC